MPPEDKTTSLEDVVQTIVGVLGLRHHGCMGKSPAEYPASARDHLEWMDNRKASDFQVYQPPGSPAGYKEFHAQCAWVWRILRSPVFAKADENVMSLRREIEAWERRAALLGEEIKKMKRHQADLEQQLCEERGRASRAMIEAEASKKAMKVRRESFMRKAGFRVCNRHEWTSVYFKNGDGDERCPVCDEARARKAAERNYERRTRTP